MGLGVAGGVLDHDLIAGVDGPLPVAFEHDGDPGLEQLRRLPGIHDRDRDAVGDDGESVVWPTWRTSGSTVPSMRNCRVPSEPLSATAWSAVLKYTVALLRPWIDQEQPGRRR